MNVIRPSRRELARERDQRARERRSLSPQPPRAQQPAAASRAGTAAALPPIDSTTVAGALADRARRAALVTTLEEALRMGLRREEIWLDGHGDRNPKHFYVPNPHQRVVTTIA